MAKIGSCPIKAYDERRDYRYAHYKYDGHMLRVVKDSVGNVSIWTRRPTNITEQVKFVPSLQSAWIRQATATIWVGELWSPKHPASAIKTLINERSSDLRFDVFACETAPHTTSLEYVESLAVGQGYRMIPYITASVHYDMHPESPRMQDLMRTEPGLEGFVYKDGNMHNLAKWKPTRTVDLVVQGFTEGKGRNEFLVGSLRCGYHNGREIANVGGITDLMRAEITADEDAYLGRVVEVAYQYVGAQGRLRHPRFVRWRDDKPAAECVESEVEL